MWAADSDESEKERLMPTKYHKVVLRVGLLGAILLAGVPPGFSDDAVETDHVPASTPKIPIRIRKSGQRRVRNDCHR